MIPDLLAASATPTGPVLREGGGAGMEEKVAAEAEKEGRERGRERDTGMDEWEYFR